MEGFPENWLSLEPINSYEVGGGEEEDDGKVILELRLGSNSSDECSPNHFEHRCPMNRSSETAVNENRTKKGKEEREASSAMSASSPPPIWGVRRGRRGVKGSISDSSKKLKMDEEGASSGSTDEENYDSWKEFLTLGLNYGEEEEKEKESEMNNKEKKEEASSSSTSFEEEKEKEKEKEKEDGHKCKICKKSFLTGQALGGHQTTHRGKSTQLVLPEAQYCKTMTS